MIVVLTDITGAKSYVIPHVPPETQITFGGKNETVDTVKGDVRLVGDKRLKEIGWDSIFPVNKEYSFAEYNSLENGYDYLDFITNVLDAKIPVGLIVMNEDKRPLLNVLATIDEGFSYSIDKAGDIKYSIKLTEFPTDKWDYSNSAKEAQAYLQAVMTQSKAKKALQKAGLI